MHLLKLLLIAVSCVVAGASWPRSPSKYEGVAAIASPLQEVHLEDSVRSLAVNSAPSSDKPYPDAASDAWLLFLSGLGMVIIQLRRRQKILQASRFEIEAELQA